MEYARKNNITSQLDDINNLPSNTKDKDFVVEMVNKHNLVYDAKSETFRQHNRGFFVVFNGMELQSFPPHFCGTQFVGTKITLLQLKDACSSLGNRECITDFYGYYKKDGITYMVDIPLDGKQEGCVLVDEFGNAIADKSEHKAEVSSDPFMDISPEASNSGIRCRTKTPSPFN
ncbi:MULTISPECIES: hypothetical protein [Cysteiniphilum]|uniref:hypothetical protein n=1 Tax=Cysteiniphilum TaxID=2056696 RepID=UPI00177AE46A|nr:MULTISPECIES: hypothetical protein [Cysteiniphilum]